MASTRAAVLNPFLPPSPPPSPPKTRQRRKKHDDPFYSTFLNQPISRAPTPEDEAPEPVQSRLKTILFTPILFTSFLLSLFIINRGDRAARASSHPQPHHHGSFLEYLSPRAWLDPEPYQDPDSTAWRTAAPASQKPDAVIAPGHGSARKKSWFLRKKHRAVVRLQIGDAFELREWVIIAMLGVGLTILAGVVWGLRRLLG